MTAGLIPACAGLERHLLARHHVVGVALPVVGHVVAGSRTRLVVARGVGKTSVGVVRIAVSALVYHIIGTGVNNGWVVASDGARVEAVVAHIWHHGGRIVVTRLLAVAMLHVSVCHVSGLLLDAGSVVGLLLLVLLLLLLQG